MIVIIPSNRTITLENLTPLIDDGARFIIVDDPPGSITIDHPQFEVYNWNDRKRMLGALDIGIPRRTGACMAFGFYIAWHDAAKDEIIITFGDDCEITDRAFPAKVREALSNRPRPLMSGTTPSFNILDAYETVGPDLFPRGFPYSERGSYVPWTAGDAVSAPSAFNLGLWTGAFDVNAVDKIRGPRWDDPDARLRHESILVPPEPLLCVCSMNMQFRQFLLPAVYQVPMHIETMPHWVVDRYGDIWGGYVLRRLMALAGDMMSVGAPTIQHNKVAGYEHNLWQEHVGHMINDEFIAVMDASLEEVQPSDYLNMMAALHDAMCRRVGTTGPMLRPYLDQMLPCLEAWTQALREPTR